MRQKSTTPCPFARHPASVSRRDFLRTAGMLTGGLLAGSFRLSARAAPFTPQFQRPVPHRWTAPSPSVALAHADSYEPALIRRTVQDMLDALGGLADVIRPGNTVVLKPNLTDGVGTQTMIAGSPVESLATHPMVVQALGEAIIDSGAGKLIIMEGVFDDQTFQRWGYEDVGAALDAAVLDLNNPAPYEDFIAQPVPDGLIYESFALHPLLAEADVLVSIAKLKMHSNAGITLGMKNLIGIVPSSHYRLSNRHNHRSALHGSGEVYRERLPRVIIDLNRARPVNLTVLDGIMTSESGEGPWVEGWQPLQANVLIAGKNVVATDAVGTAVMGHNPAAESLAEVPFEACDNHLAVAAELGMGPLHLDDINVVGESVDELGVPFAPYSGPERFD